MVPATRTRAAAVAVATLVAGVLTAPTASAQPDDPATEIQPAPVEPVVLHNVLYRARADGTSRGAVVAYKMDDQNVNSAQPTLLPGQTFEINAVLADPTKAGMELSIEWPYGSNLHCEILVDDQIVAKADQFIAPRLRTPKDDPLYGVLQCGAPLNLPIDGVAPPAVSPDAPDPAPPAPDAQAVPAA
ncbi:hypothetical protein [Mycobacterium sp. NAZ190054]|uniref:hypothetical protein n=1 Tax=Mycobacterium sp. NAZ190054 TaxID=1747766 RepID=UPI00079ADB20|nr:hypothetical protein [Mycobacterium sp. NAZ190054]KWX63218.1 hypothetical protein ASJ79_08580 [Mycobacterium sp. NAZ190054]